MITCDENGRRVYRRPCACGCGRLTGGMYARACRPAGLSRLAGERANGTAERNRAIVERFSAGEQTSVLAREFCVSRQRIDQIITKYRLPKHGPARRERAGNWKGGRLLLGNGYVTVLLPEHPRAGQHGYVLEHIVVAEASLGRALLPGEVVHHRNGQKDDNRPENLQVLTLGEHARLHNGFYTLDILTAALQWRALRLGHTPRNADLCPPDFPIWWTLYYNHFGSMTRSAHAAGLIPNGRGAGGAHVAPLPLGFRRQHADLLRFATVEALIEDRFGGLLTQHEREKLFAASKRERAA